ncbi:hypothetical protein HK107_12625 [Parvularcula sp. ZS-1/3]|uniref:EF-hand domain-containing protein n=1 Tax=Parvularcula mediterranea TaxID=2732508 RepID=A0A7Y3W656_9PROT|nr:hypothetical protein [Parvularcula mediterranea]NNU17168.1 hypothetical protein [Parvularcula mediterranea]
MRARSFLLALPLAAACASQEPPRGGPGGQQGGRADAASMMRSAQQIARPESLFFAGMDQDSDGAVTQDEMILAGKAIFAAADGEGDGVLRPIEVSAMAETFFGTRNAPIGTSSFDRDSSASVSLSEFESFITKRFVELDENGDGILQRSELLVTMQPPARGQAGGQRGGGGRGGGGGGRGGRRG